MRFFIISSIICFLCFSCCPKQNEHSNNITEGEILYTISYPQDIESQDFSFIYPKEMTLFFKDNYQRLSFKGNMGMYYFDFIYKDKIDTVYTLLKIQLLGQKLYVPTCGTSLLVFSESPEDRETILTNETKEISGIVAKKAILKSLISENSDIVVWYSDSVSIESPNQNTPFYQIPGILLESEIIFKNVKFIFSAKKITFKKVPDEMFKVPAEYKLTTISEIEELLYSVF